MHAYEHRYTRTKTLSISMQGVNFKLRHLVPQRNGGSSFIAVAQHVVRSALSSFQCKPCVHARV